MNEKVKITIRWSFPTRRRSRASFSSCPWPECCPSLPLLGMSRVSRPCPNFAFPRIPEEIIEGIFLKGEGLGSTNWSENWIGSDRIFQGPAKSRSGFVGFYRFFVGSEIGFLSVFCRVFVGFPPSKIKEKTTKNTVLLLYCLKKGNSIRACSCDSHIFNRLRLQSPSILALYSAKLSEDSFHNAAWRAAPEDELEFWKVSYFQSVVLPFLRSYSKPETYWLFLDRSKRPKIALDRIFFGRRLVLSINYHNPIFSTYLYTNGSGSFQQIV